MALQISTSSLSNLLCKYHQGFFRCSTRNKMMIFPNFGKNPNL